MNDTDWVKLFPTNMTEQHYTREGNYHLPKIEKKTLILACAL